MQRLLAFDFGTDVHAQMISDQYMYGPCLMVAPMVDVGESRTVYLPPLPNLLSPNLGQSPGTQPAAQSRPISADADGTLPTAGGSWYDVWDGSMWPAGWHANVSAMHVYGMRMCMFACVYVCTCMCHAYIYVCMWPASWHANVSSPLTHVTPPSFACTHVHMCILMHMRTYAQVSAPLTRVPLFARRGSLMPIGPPLQYTDEKPSDPLEVSMYVCMYVSM